MSKELYRIVSRYRREKGLPQKIALTFPDVLIIDRRSRISSRSDISNLKTSLARNIALNIPIVSANMADVTESRMATALARLGGLGFIHQFMPIERRVEEIRKVKRADNEVIENPWTVNLDQLLTDAIKMMDEKQTTGLLVVDNDGRLVGILTSRDVRFAYRSVSKDPSTRVRHLMSSVNLITAPLNVSVDEAVNLLNEHRIEKLPLVDEMRKPVGLITAKDILKKLEFPNALRDKRGRLMVGATVGLPQNFLEEVSELVKAGADVILVDTARANSERTVEVVKAIRSGFENLPIVAGNIDNPEGAFAMIRAGADCVKVGIGPGSACKTRTETGVGVPQLSAIAECAAVAKEYNVSIIADGGISEGSELAKAIVAGADSVMLGGLFAGTEETPGDVYLDAGERFKLYRGSAGLDSQLRRFEEGDLDRVRAPEGVTRKVAYKGQKVEEIVRGLMENLRSSMSYANAATIAEFQKKQFRYQTQAGYLEGKPKK